MYIDGSYESCKKSLDELLEDVENGDPEALYIIGRRMDEGDGLGQNRETGIDYMRSSAEKGYAPAQNYMGYLHSHGDYLPKDDLAAVEWFSKAADQGLPKAKCNLAFFYKDGKGGLDKDRGIYLKLMREAAESDYPSAQYYMGEAYYYGEGVDKDYTQAAAWYLKSAEQSDPDAQFSLGYMYEYGYGFKSDIDEAVRWYRDSSAKGRSNATFRLGFVMYYKMSAMDDEGILMFKKASDQGNSHACYRLYLIYAEDEAYKDKTEARYWLFKGISKNNLDCIKEAGKQYLSGNLLPSNPGLAIKCYEKGAEMNDEECLYLLGELYESGKHVEADVQKAMGYYEKAAATDECRAQYRMGDHYLYGEGDDPDMALYWYRRAACNGSVMAMKELARIYEQGIMVTQSITRAIYWYNRAYLKKDELAKAEMDRLSDCFNPLVPEMEEEPNEKAKRLAVENYDSDECYNLGTRYMEGKDGLEKDLVKSKLWFELGSDLDNTYCLDYLGYMYYYVKVQKPTSKRPRTASEEPPKWEVRIPR